MENNSLVPVRVYLEHPTYTAKRKAPILSCAATAQLICAFVFAFMQNAGFSHGAAHTILVTVHRSAIDCLTEVITVTHVPSNENLFENMTINNNNNNNFISRG